MTISTRTLAPLKVRNFLRLTYRFDMEPPYQRDADVWNDERRSRFIDSILKGYLIPSVYLEKLGNRPTYANPPRAPRQQFAVLDGKQRLQSIISFYENEFQVEVRSAPIETDDTDEDTKKMYFRDLEDEYPEIASRFLEFEIPGIIVETDSNDDIEDMFDRLNSSSSLTAAERRNAISCEMRDATNELAKHNFFTQRCPIKNMRYKYRELASKMLTIEHQLDENDQKLKDLKAATLLSMFKKSKQQVDGLTNDRIRHCASRVKDTLNKMTEFFENDDRLLRSIGTLIVYYLCFRGKNFASAANRDLLSMFEDDRKRVARDDVDFVSDPQEAQRFREYAAQIQSSNDGVALQSRASILEAYVLHAGKNWASDLTIPDFEGEDEKLE